MIASGAKSFAQPQTSKSTAKVGDAAARTVIIGNPLPPSGEKLPTWFVVTTKQPKWWGFPGYLDELAVIRISFDNRSEQEISLLNLSFLEPRFVVMPANGHERAIPVQLGNGYRPSINPQMIIGPKSRVSFDLNFRHPSKKSFGAGARFRSEATIRFWMRDYHDQGKLQNFEFTIPFSVVDAPGMVTR